MQDFPDLYVGYIGTKVIFKITDLAVSSRATKARLRQFYPSTKSSSTILPMGLAYLKDQVVFANAEHRKASIIALNVNRQRNDCPSDYLSYYFIALRFVPLE